VPDRDGGSAAPAGELTPPWARPERRARRSGADGLNHDPGWLTGPLSRRKRRRQDHDPGCLAGPLSRP
jgi:hypothetical protein